MPGSADSQSSVPAEDSAAAAAGRKLREAREAAGISITEVNARIHLTREVVGALEAGEFDEIGARVFVRGHIRSYARLLNVPEQQILDACPDAEPEADVFRTHSALREFRPGFSIVNAILLAALLLLLLIAFVYWLAGDDAETETSARLWLPAASYVVSSASLNGNNTARYEHHLPASSFQA